MPGIDPAARTFLRDAFAYERGRLVLLTLLAALGAVAQGAGLVLLVPLLGFLGVGDAAPHLPVRVGLEGAVALYLGIVLAAALLVRARALAAARLRLAFIDGLRERLHTALLALRWEHFLRLRGADVQQTLMMEVARAGMAMEQLASLLSAALVVPVMLGVAIGLSGPMALATLALGAVIAVASIPLNRRSSQLGHEAGAVAMATNAVLADDLAGMRVVKAFSLEAARGAAFRARLHAMRQRQLDLVAATATSAIVVRATGAAVAALCLILAVRRFEMPLGDALVFMLAFARLVTAALRIQEEWRRLLHAAPAYARARAMLAEFERAGEAPATGTPPALRDGLVLTDIAFRYPQAERPALDRLSAQFPRGQITAILGPSGAGKSTLVDVLLGLVEPERGSVAVDGVAITGATRGAWRRAVGYVPQEAMLFHDTIRANLRVAAPDADDAALWHALEQAAAADVVRRLPDGLDTMVGDRGARLSGGERQRITLARALLRAPTLLLLDEATSAIDAHAETQILAALQALKGDLTIILVAHRSAIVQAADHVVLLDQGRLVAEGPWPAVRAAAEPVLQRLQLG